MKVVFMGTPDFAVGTLEALLKSEHEVAAVVTQPDKPKGRGKSMQFPPVKEVAVKAGIPVLQPVKVRSAEAVEEIRAFQPDAIVVVAFGQLIPREILEMPKFGCINVHASLLPKYRGAAPIQWAVIQGEKTSGVTTMRMDEGLDTGDMLLTEEVELEKDETGGSLFDKLSQVGADLLIRTLKELEEGTVTARTQPRESPTAYAAMLKKEMGLMDWNRSAVELERLIRGLNPWPSAYTYINGKTLKIWKAAVCGQPEDDRDARIPGMVAEVGKDAFRVQTGDGLLEIREVQLEGKKRMAAADFMRGYEIKEHLLLGQRKN